LKINLARERFHCLENYPIWNAFSKPAETYTFPTWAPREVRERDGPGGLSDCFDAILLNVKSSSASWVLRRTPERQSDNTWCSQKRWITLLITLSCLQRHVVR